MKNLIPQMIAERAIQNLYHGSFRCYSMLVDISGFTVMTNSLMDIGKEGAEILSFMIEEIFTPAINSVYQNRGFIATFGGDSFTALFLVEEAEYSLQSAFSIYKLFLTPDLGRTKVGDFHLIAKIGLSWGDVEYQIIDAQIQKAFYFRGLAIDGCAKSENRAQDMEMVADNSFISQLTVHIDTKNIDEEHVLIPFIEDFSFKGLCPSTLKRSSCQDLSTIEASFLPKAVLDLEGRGEFRDIISCYIHFKEEGDYKESLAQLIQNCYEYGGYFDKIYFTDKGGFSLILFGAPEGKEKLYQRGAEFALIIRDVPGFSCRIGLATGIAFSGFFGSHLRKEYTALGNVVNRSARIMMEADWGQIRLDKGVAKNLQEQFQVRSEGFSSLKGFHHDIEIFSLKEPKEKEGWIYADTFVGREDETIVLQEYVKPIFNKEFGGIVYIDGPPGIGKSCFIANFQQQMGQAQFIYLPCDEILQKAFNPFAYYFIKFFNQSQSATKEENRRRFENRFADLLSQITHEEIKKELVRTKTIIGALINLEWEDSLYEKLDSKGRYENTVFAIKNYLTAQSLLKPTVMVIEDGQWMDHDSLEVIKILVRNVKDYPFILCALCRPKDDGSKVHLVEEEEIDAKRIELPAFTKSYMEELVRDKLQINNIPKSTQDFIWDKSLGNPFFAEQFLLYLQENSLLDKEYCVQVESYAIPEGIHQIIIARIDRLTIKLKETVKTASVLGREFTLQVLRKMLSSSTIIKENEFKAEITDICNQQIWDLISEINIIFKHALIRDTVYDMQLKGTLRTLHNLAGDAIEELYYGNIKAYYEELADHYDLAGNRDKAIVYLEKAGEQAKENYQNNQAIVFYDKLLKYYSEKEDTKTATILLKKGVILELIGRWDEALHVFEKVLALAKEIDDDILNIDCMWHMSNIFNGRGKIDDALRVLKESLKMSESMDYKKGISNATIAQGDIYFLQGDHVRAKNCYQKGRDISYEIGDKRGVSNALRCMGNAYYYQNDYINAMKFYEHSIAISQEINEKINISKCYDNIGTIYNSYHEDYVKALEYREKALAISEEIGDKKVILTILYNIGIVYVNMENFIQGLKYFTKVLTMSQELDEKKIYAYAYNNMGFIYQYLNEYAKAMDCYKISRTIGEAIGEKYLISILFENIGEIYFLQEDYRKAMFYLNKSLPMLEEQKNHTGVLKVMNTIARIYFQKGDFSIAMKTLKKALVIGEKFIDNDIITSTNYTTISRLKKLMGDIYREQGDFEKAMKYYDKSIHICKNKIMKNVLEKNDVLCLVLSSKADLLFKSSMIEEAKVLNQEALEIAKEIGNKPGIDAQFHTTILAHKIYKNTEGLLRMLDDENLEEKKKGDIYYDLWQLTQEEKYKQKSIKIYQAYMESTPNYICRKRVEEMISF